MFERILIVEDDADMRMAIADKLIELHYEVIQAEDGEQAVAKFIQERPRLMILDLMLPKMGGFEVLEKLKQEMNLVKTPVVIYSNLNKVEDMQKAKDLNINNFLIKAQSQIDDVCTRVKTLLSENT